MEGTQHAITINLPEKMESEEFRLLKMIKIDLNQAIGIILEVGVKTSGLSRKKHLRKRKIQSIMMLIRPSAIRIR